MKRSWAVEEEGKGVSGRGHGKGRGGGVKGMRDSACVWSEVIPTAQASRALKDQCCRTSYVESK